MYIKRAKVKTKGEVLDIVRSKVQMENKRRANVFEFNGE